MKQDLGFSFGDFGLMTTAFFVPYTVGQLVFGHLSSRGRVRIFMLPGLVVIIASTMLLGEITNLPEALLLRFVTGMAGATLFTPSMILISKLFPGRTNTALGVLGTGACAGPLYTSLVTPFLGGLLGWRMALFTMMAPFLAVWVVIYLTVADFPAPSEEVAVPSGDLRADVLGQESTWLLGCLNLVRVGLLGTMVVFLPTFFASGLGYPVATAGLALGVFSVMAILSSVSGGRLATLLHSNARVSVVSMAALAVGFFCAGFASPGPLAWLIAAFLGLFIFAAFGPTFTMASQVYSGDSLGLGMGLQNALANGGSIVIPYIFGSLRDVTGNFEVPFLAMGTLAVAAAIVGFEMVGVETRKLRPKEPSPPVLVSSLERD
jgi:nitrate/nitrite transporter NarK